MPRYDMFGRLVTYNVKQPASWLKGMQMIFVLVHPCAQLGPKQAQRQFLKNGTSNASHPCAEFVSSVSMCAMQCLLRDRWNKAERWASRECTDRCVHEVHFIGDTQFVLGELFSSTSPGPKNTKTYKNNIGNKHVISRSQALHKCWRCCFFEVGESSKIRPVAKYQWFPIPPSSKSQLF